MAPRDQQPRDTNALLLTKFDALTNQIDRLNNFLEAQFKREQKIAQEPATMRAKQDEEMALFDERLGYARAPRQRKGQTSLFETEVGREPQLQQTWRGIPDDDRRLPPNSKERKALLADYRERVGAGNSRYRAMLGALGARQSSSDTPDPNVNSSLPPGQSGHQVGGPFGNHTGDVDMLSWAVLGEHGGPRFIRNLALEQYGLKRSIGWAQNAANLLSSKYDDNRVLQAIPGINKETLGALSGALEVAQDHPYATFAAYKGLQIMGNAMNQASANLQSYQALGQQLGYGPPAAVGQNFMGIRNPLGSFGMAAQVGASANVTEQALMGRLPGMGFGNGLSSTQAKDVMSTLTGQGFGMQPMAGGGFGGAIGNALSSIPGVGGILGGLFGDVFGQPKGDAALIAQNFMRPLMERFPGLSAQDLGQFTGSLRYGGTSIQQLTDQLNNLGVEARAAKETVGQFSSSVANTAQQFENLGSSTQGGVAIGTGFTNVTGKDAQFAASFGQSPLVQGLAMSQYGILPSGLGDMNSGTFANTSLSALMMMQRALSGLDQNKYAMVNGHRVLIQSGQQAVYDQIAHMMGLPSNVVKSMLQDQRGIQARAHAQEMLGDPTTGTGFYRYLDQHKGKLTDAQYKYASQLWHDTVGDTWQGTGISRKQYEQMIKNNPGLRDRAKAYAGLLANAAKNDRTNQIQNTPNSQTVQVQFTGAAAKFFQQVPTSPNKLLANAGDVSYTSIANSIPGDVNMPTSWTVGAIK